MLAFVGLHWPSLAFFAFVALDDFLKQKLAFADKIQAQLACFQQSDVKTNYQTRSVILKHCENLHQSKFPLSDLKNCFL
jgi:hypothetical protein